MSQPLPEITCVSYSPAQFESSRQLQEASTRSAIFASKLSAMLAYGNGVVRKLDGSLSAWRRPLALKKPARMPQVPLTRLEAETLQWCREMMRNSPTALRILKAAMNAAEDGQAGIQVLPNPHVPCPDCTHVVFAPRTASSSAEPYAYIQEFPFNRLNFAC